MDNNLLTIGRAAELLNVSVMTLRRWDRSGRLPAFKSPGGHRYYDPDTILRLKQDIWTVAMLWSNSGIAPAILDEYYSDTRDRFQARLDRMGQLIAGIPDQAALAPLLPALAGEIGNNSFDHNLGNWPDVPGTFFAYNTSERQIILADRGLGIRATLSRVRSLPTDIEALEVAMNYIISGRSPENRGNGLKFVRNVALEYPLGISLQSGVAVATIEKDGPKDLKITLAERNIRGVLARIEY